MHPITSKPDRAWIVYAGGAAVSQLIAMMPLARGGAVGVEAAWLSPWGLLLVVFALQSWHIARYVPIGKVAFSRYIFTAAAAATAASGCWVAIGWGTAAALRAWLPSLLPAFREAWPSLWIAGGALFVCLLFLQSALDAADQGEASARRALASEVASRDAELRALRAQVDPHFLFNCLHSISSLIARDPDAARRMCFELADFFRTSLKAGAEARIPLSTELQLVRGYLGIEQVRFGNRLRVQVDAHAEAGDAPVPPLLLQPLVENAVRHGIATLVDGGTVAVSVIRSADRIGIGVENPFDPDGRRPGTGVGLANVRDRLEAAYGGAATIRVDTMPDATPLFRVSMSLPVEEPAGD